MKTASRILGSALFARGFEVQDAPRYGAERRGAPIFAYVRADRSAIRERGVIRVPDLVVVADETLFAVAAAGVLEGTGPRSALLLCSDEPAATWRERLRLAGPLATLPAPAGDLPLVGAACAAGAARCLGLVPREALEGALREELAELPAPVVEANLARARAAWEALADHEGCVLEGVPAAVGAARPGWIDLPLDEGTRAAPEVHGAATSVQVRTGLWRTMRPVIDRELCHRCSWICSTFCPDSAIEVDPDGSPRIDLEHCKGCLVCAAVCPPHAIGAVPEREAARAERRAAEQAP